MRDPWWRLTAYMEMACGKAVDDASQRHLTRCPIGRAIMRCFGPAPGHVPPEIHRAVATACDEYKLVPLTALLFAGADQNQLESALGLARSTVRIVREHLWDDSVWDDALDRRKWVHTVLGPQCQAAKAAGSTDTVAVELFEWCNATLLYGLPYVLSKLNPDDAPPSNAYLRRLVNIGWQRVAEASVSSSPRARKDFQASQTQFLQALRLYQMQQQQDKADAPTQTRDWEVVLTTPLSPNGLPSMGDSRVDGPLIT